MSWLRRILSCSIGSHNYYEVRRLNNCCHLIGCRDCSKLWGMNTTVHALVSWDSELEDQHRLMGDFEPPKEPKP